MTGPVLLVASAQAAFQMEKDLVKEESELVQKCADLYRTFEMSDEDFNDLMSVQIALTLGFESPEELSIVLGDDFNPEIEYLGACMHFVRLEEG